MVIETESLFRNTNNLILIDLEFLNCRWGMEIKKWKWKFTAARHLQHHIFPKGVACGGLFLQIEATSHGSIQISILSMLGRKACAWLLGRLADLNKGSFT